MNVTVASAAIAPAQTALVATRLSNALTTILSNLGSALSALLISFATALATISDLLVVTFLTPLCTAAATTQRTVVFAIASAVFVVAYKLKTCKLCFGRSFHSASEEANDLAFRILRSIADFDRH